MPQEEAFQIILKLKIITVIMAIVMVLCRSNGQYGKLTILYFYSLSLDKNIILWTKQLLWRELGCKQIQLYIKKGILFREMYKQK